MKMATTALTLTIVSYLLCSGCVTAVSDERVSQCRVTLSISQCPSLHHHHNSTISTMKNHCNTNPICDHKFTISHFGNNAYGVQLVEQVLHTCCGACTKTIQKEDLLEMWQLKEVMENVDIVFPILGKVGDWKLHGYYFIPLIEAPQAYFVTHTNHHILRDVIMSCLNLWPLLLVTSMMVLISGKVWLLYSFDLTKEII